MKKAIYKQKSLWYNMFVWRELGFRITGRFTRLFTHRLLSETQIKKER